MADDALMSTAEAAVTLKVSVATLNRWVAAGKLTPAMQYPGRTGARLYRREDVEALAAEQATAETAESAS